MRCSLRSDAQLTTAEAKVLVGRLAPIQRKILSGLLGGESGRSLAAVLQMGSSDYEAQRAALMTRLNAGSTAEAVRIALLAGMDEPRGRTSPD